MFGVDVYNKPYASSPVEAAHIVLVIARMRSMTTHHIWLNTSFTLYFFTAVCQQSYVAALETRLSKWLFLITLLKSS